MNLFGLHCRGTTIFVAVPKARNPNAFRVALYLRAKHPPRRHGSYASRKQADEADSAKLATSAPVTCLLCCRKGCQDGRCFAGSSRKQPEAAESYRKVPVAAGSLQDCRRGHVSALVSIIANCRKYAIPSLQVRYTLYHTFQ